MSQVKIVSPRAELTVLKALCCPNLKVSGLTLAQVDESYFFNEVSRELYNCIKERFAETAKAPSEQSLLEDPEISAEAKDFLKAGAKIEVSDESEAKKAVKILNKYRCLRIFSGIAQRIGDEFSKSKIDLEGLTQEVVTQINVAQATKSTPDCFLHFGRGDNAKDFMHEIIYGEDTGDLIPTGFKVFDELSGGFERGSLVTLGATSGGGKSTLATQMCLNMAHAGYKVILVPLEMSKKEMGNRILANIGSMELTKIRRHQLDDREKDLLSKRQRAWRKETYQAGGRLTIFRPEEDLDIDEVFAAVSALNCDVCVIDYISLLKGIDDENQWLRLGTIARRAKVNAEVTNRINVLLCQVSDNGKIRYSGAVKEHSTSSWVWTPSVEDKESGLVRIEQIKSRNSQPFPFSLRFKWNRMQVESVDDSAESEGVIDPPMDEKDLVNLAADI